MSTISASTTSTTAYKVTADTTGTLVLQTGSSPTTAVTIDGSQNVGLGTSTPNYAGYSTNVLTIAASGVGGGVAELATTRADASGNYAGTLAFIASQNGTGLKAIAQIDAVTTGSTANNRGGYMYFTTKADGGSAAERMRIDSSGRVTTPYQPAFNAYNASTGSPVIWASYTLNTGGHYSTSTGRFTAPVAGTYLFYVSIHCSNAAGGISDFRFKLNNGDTSGGAACASPSNYAQGTGVVVMNLIAGDFVTVGALHGFTNDVSLSYFGGYLLG